MEIILHNQTERMSADLARKLAKKLFPGAFLAFYGGLGAGKTTFIRNMAEALGIEDISSPTFTIIHEHENGKIPFYHIDAYRLSSSDELFASGFSDYLEKNGIIAVEWSENVPEALPAEYLKIAIGGNGDQPRTITLSAMGEKYNTIIDEVAR